MLKTTRLWLILLAALCLAACGGDPDATGDSGTDAGDDDGGADTDSDSDADCENPGIFDEGTGLIWLRCLAGQCLVEDVCTWEGGDAVGLTHDEAAAACPDDARLPTMEEIMGLLGGCEDGIDLAVDTPYHCAACQDSAACDAVYPGVDELGPFSYEILHWSSTELNDSRMWWINFQSGLLEAKLAEMSATAVCVLSE